MEKGFTYIFSFKVQVLDPKLEWGGIYPALGGGIIRGRILCNGVLFGGGFDIGNNVTGAEACRFVAHQARQNERLAVLPVPHRLSLGTAMHHPPSLGPTSCSPTLK